MEEIPSEAKAAYNRNKASAERRGIGFDLSRLMTAESEPQDVDDY